MSQLAVVDPSKRSQVAFPVQSEPWNTIAAWAKKWDYRLIETATPTTRLYQRGIGFLTAPMRAAFSLDGGQLTVQAWVHVPLFNRIFAFFLIPAEMHVGSGGFRLVIPRNMARKAMNELLPQLGGPAIP